MIEGALFFIIELKLHLSGTALADYVAQLFLEILCECPTFFIVYIRILSLLPAAVKRNSKYNLKNLKVYGLLSDFTTFKFYTYNPETQTFSNNSTMWVGLTRENVCMDMIEGSLHLVTLRSYLTVLFPPVVNKIFGILLTGYIASLEVITETSLDRGKISDVSTVGTVLATWDNFTD